MKHTPGPWTFHQNGDGSYSILGKKLSEKEYQWVASFIQNGEIWTEEQISNARLIAAAPELLECLQKLIVLDIEDFEEQPNEVFDAFWNAKQTVKKAIE